MTGDGVDAALASLSAFKTKRASVTGQLTKLKKFVDSASRTISLHEWEVKLGLLETYLKKFDDAQTIIEIMDDAELESDRRGNFEDIYSDLKTRILIFMDSKKSSSFAGGSTVANESTLLYMKPKIARLPKLELTKFSGKYTEWPDFLSMFETLVHGDEEISTIEKFQHLRSCLSDLAFRTIQSLEITAENYPKAIELLKARFDNKRLIFQAHIKEIFNLPNVDGGSVHKLRDLSDSVNSHLRALNTLGSKEELSDGLLIHLVLSKLDSKNRTKWEEDTPVNALPKWNQLSLFMEKRCQTLETMVSATGLGYKQSYTVNNSRKSNKTTIHTTFITSNTPLSGCRFCGSNDHTIYLCEIFAKLSPENRYREAKAKKLCINCLRAGHQARNCSSHNCKHCSQRHSTLLHMGPIINRNSQTNVLPIESRNLPTTHTDSNLQSNNTVLVSKSYQEESSSNKNHLEHKPFVFLATALVLVRDRYDAYVPCRALLDSCSQMNFATDCLIQHLNLKRTKATNPIGGIGEVSTVSKFKSNIVMRSRLNEYTVSLDVHILPSITSNQPDQNLDIDDFNLPANVELADPYFNQSQRIDLLIGAELFFDLLSVGQIRLGENLPLLQKTLLGWIVAGKLKPYKQTLFSFNAVAQEVPDSELDELFKSFWEIETHETVSKIPTVEEIECEDFFCRTYQRLPSGQFSVRLPLKKTPNELGNSFKLAQKRFYNLESKLYRNPHLRKQYIEFINEYIQLNHMSQIHPDVLNRHHFFLPHHCVTKADSTTTKLRVVFDGSAKSSTGLSLNDILMVGQTIQDDLFTILIRFRMHRFAITADVSKMYRCVRIQPPDDNLQLILWRENKNDQLGIFKLNTVTYGTSSASFLAIRSMIQLSLDEHINFPIGSKIIQKDFYVDDLLTGANTLKEIVEIKDQTTELLKLGGFHLRKWCSNSDLFLNTISEENKETFLEINRSQVTKTLGLIWQPDMDEFRFFCPPIENPQIVTKRSILSRIAKLYDPLGLISPIVIKAKMLMQSLWKERLHWDESLPQQLHSTWLEYSSQLIEINNLKFPRYVVLPNCTHEAHGFADASQNAYGACIYLRSEDPMGKVSVQLLCSKSRVTPVKTVSIPRLELCAALLLSELMQRIRIILKLETCKAFCWSDSTIVLSWLQSNACNWNTFVSNRVAKIQNLSAHIVWRHVPTNLNPADLISRGVSPKNLLQLSIWVSGPKFLLENEERWPILSKFEKILPEGRTTNATALLAGLRNGDLSTGCKFLNSFSQIVRVFAYMLRFYYNVRSDIDNRKMGQLTTKELDLGLKYIIRMIQRNEFSEEYRRLSSNQEVKETSNLKSLAPFLDEFGVMRVRGRLQNSSLSFESKHPIILPRTHPFTSAVINHFHIKNMHAGSHALLAALRMEFWPIGGKHTIRKVINKCIRCYKARPMVMQQLQGNLLSQRVQQSRPFFTSGVDFCGPFYVHSRIRGRAPTKTYICLFVCFAVKAVHLELATDLSSAAFLGALKRFIARRGKPQTIFSDNATNFVGANAELKELQHLFHSQAHIDSVYQTCLNDGIQWKFIPARSPHFGGLWESSIKTAKYHFRRVAGYASLSFEELHTLSCQIEAIINSRPLSPISDDPSDIQALTPGHFLIGAPLTATLEPDITDSNPNRLTRWQIVRFTMQHFWKRWSKEYLTSLQQRQKWEREESNISVGALVLLKDDNLPPLKWSLGRVLEVFPGADGLVRVVSIKTLNGVLKRAITKICKLPLDNEKTLS